MNERQICELLFSKFQCSAGPSGSLLVTPKSELTPEVREAIRTHKAAILDELATWQWEQWRKEWEQIAWRL